MPSIVVHIRFPEDILAKGIDGMNELALPPPRHLNDIVRTGFLAGLSLMLGPDYNHNPATSESLELVGLLTKQKTNGGQTNTINNAIRGKLEAKQEESEHETPAADSPWKSIDIKPTIAKLPDSDQADAGKIWTYISSGHIQPQDQLTAGDGKIDRLASWMLWHHKENFPEFTGKINEVYAKYWKETKIL